MNAHSGPREARSIIQRHDPERAARLNALDPVPLPCTCADPHWVDLHVFESRDAVARLCTRCGRSQA